MSQNNHYRTSNYIMRNVLSLTVGIFTLVGMLSFTPSASAVLIYSASIGGAPTGASYANFDALPLGNAAGSDGGIAVSFTGDGKVVVGAVSGQYAAPWISGSNGTHFGNAAGVDITRYLTTGLGTVKLDFGADQQYMGLLWGSVDLYNTLSFYNSSNTLVGQITGGNINTTATGDQGVNGTYYVNINSNVGFRYVVASSTQYAFEFDNVAYNPEQLTVPEPETYALLMSGLLLATFIRQKRKVTS